jgi:hypothetical protein
MKNFHPWRWAAVLCLSLSLFSDAVAQSQWSQLGSPQFSANITQIDKEGNWLFAGASSGLWFSMNTGISWHKLSNPVPEINDWRGVDAVGYKLYAIGRVNNFYYVVYPTPTTSKFYYSTNLGQTFKVTDAPVGPLSMVVTGNKIHVLASHGLFLSTNNGQTFQPVSIPDLPGNFVITDGQITKTSIGKVIACDGYDTLTNVYQNFFLSSQDDVHWKLLNTNATSNQIPKASDFFFLKNGRYFAGQYFAGCENLYGTGGIYRSPDQGANWYPVDDANFTGSGQLAAQGSNRLFARNSNANTYKYTEDGLHWSDVNVPKATDILWGSGNTFVTTGRTTAISNNNGQKWTTTPTHPTGNEIIKFLKQKGQTHFMGTAYHGLYRSVATPGQDWDVATASWKPVLNNTQADGTNNIWDMAFDGNVILAGGDFGFGYQHGIYRSTDDGLTWTKVYEGTGLCFYVDGATIYAGVDYEGVLRSIDHGLTWTPINNGIVSFYYPSPSRIFRSGNRLIASFYGDGIYISDDAGENWTTVWDKTAVVVATLKTSDWLLSTGDNFIGNPFNPGLYRSTDNGSNWELLPNDLAGKHISAMYHDPAPGSKKIFFGTLERGMYVSNDDGLTVAPFNQGAPTDCSVSYLGSEGDKLYAGLYQDGWYFYEDQATALGLWQRSKTAAKGDASTDRSDVKIGGSTLSVFPNPANTTLKINLPNGQDVFHLFLMNNTGAVVRDLTSSVVGQTQVQVPVQDLQAGVYYLILFHNNDLRENVPVTITH